MKRNLPDSQYAMSLEEVAQQLGICRQRVSEIERKALAKIKDKLVGWADRDQAKEIKR